MKRASLMNALLVVVPLFSVSLSPPASAADDAAKAAKAVKVAKGASPAKIDIDMVQFKMGSVTKKMAKEGWAQNETTLGIIQGD